MKAFANIVVPALLAAALLVGLAWEYREQRRSRKRRSADPAPVPRDGEPLSESDADVLAALEQDFKDGHYAREPRRARRRP